MDKKSTALTILILLLPLVAGLFTAIAVVMGVSMFTCLKIVLWTMGSAPILIAIASEIAGRSIISRRKVDLLQPATAGITRKYNPLQFYLIQSLLIGIGIYLLIMISKLSSEHLG
ncbi:hypothetical protein [Coraliomargarita akajimensis]|uniref:Uncharacterized protein n=1 Tax=Coraliomargarita akajimensis (strain DSM 45221 / IAM 15411 / JCM 23193 / KCTC 12865 / 04OKA010-24) TaxID=583355 RepID=D5ENS9_CORAD|nr:hypothetical protein [Coraliomargarita akajimensis]ADE53588.1 hypothetical protein Caka_0563 [Coraliomargarita akajimensis DSM 45221]